MVVQMYKQSNVSANVPISIKAQHVCCIDDQLVDVCYLMQRFIIFIRFQIQLEFQSFWRHSWFRGLNDVGVKGRRPYVFNIFT